MKRLVFVIEPPTNAMQRALARRLFSTLLKKSGVGYWRHFTNAWLVRDPKDRSAKWWRDALRRRMKGGRILVLDVTVDTWAGSGPTGTFEWLHKGWKSA